MSLNRIWKDGENSFSFQLYGVKPDIICMSKALTAECCQCVTVSTQEVLQAFYVIDMQRAIAMAIPNSKNPLHVLLLCRNLNLLTSERNFFKKYWSISNVHQEFDREIKESSQSKEP